MVAGRRARRCVVRRRVPPHMGWRARLWAGRRVGGGGGGRRACAVRAGSGGADLGLFSPRFRRCRWAWRARGAIVIDMMGGGQRDAGAGTRRGRVSITIRFPRTAWRKLWGVGLMRALGIEMPGACCACVSGPQQNGLSLHMRRTGVHTRCCHESKWRCCGRGHGGGRSEAGWGTVVSARWCGDCVFSREGQRGASPLTPRGEGSCLFRAWGTRRSFELGDHQLHFFQVAHGSADSH